MVRRVAPSQLRSMLRQAAQKQRQAVNDYNRKMRAHNQKAQQAVDNYNRKARAYNARVRANRQRLNNEIAKSIGKQRRQASSSFVYR